MATIRKPAAAGKNSFYPSSAVELTKMIAGLFSEVEKTPLGGPPVALIAPHAGYIYSGRVAAKAFKLLEGEQFDTVVVVSPSHTVFFKGCSVYDGDGYETPLGIVEVDKRLAKRIAEINPLVRFSSQGHATGSERGEHALEVMLPFLQVALGKFTLVPIVMGDQEPDSIGALGEILASVLRETNTLLVASTDLSHFHPEKEANKLDGAIQKAVESLDPGAVMETLYSGKGEACGAGPVSAVMAAAKRLGATEVRSLDYATSGTVTGDFSEVVGYYSAVLVGDKKVADQREMLGQKAAKLKKQEAAEKLTDDDKQLLHKIVKDSIRASLDNKKYTPPDVTGKEQLESHQGAFVTLSLLGELRGCIGQIRGRQPLVKTIAEMAQAAAFDDPRFPELTLDEFEQLEIEISVLTPLKRVRDYDLIKIGRDGLMIKLDYSSGLLLPQVAGERHWTVEQFLEQTCLKAGLPKNSYKDKNTEVYKFSADVF